MEASAAHRPVMVAEVVTWLDPARGGTFVDCTLGLGGHTRALLEAGAGRVIGFDRDADALERARVALASFGDRVAFVHADYKTLDAALDAQGIGRVDGLLADLGVSSMQLDEEGRGMSFRRDEPLDMRMDRSTGPTVADLLVDVDETELADVIYRFGEERHSRRVARAIVRARADHPLRTTGELASLVRRAVPTRGWQRIDPATRTFQALRIWVNGELDGLDVFLTAAAHRLADGARMAVIAFHSLEDRIVKHTLRGLAQSDRALVQVLTKRPLEATDAEVAENPRARSAKLRVAERLAGAA
ncbi:MAG: 16S rRNA (cytosine(1402)-N(4))-methyltransferase RsmH [Vicinamibacterales bacterium]|nr:16S rRNA (cytosine(1402)-N(4))-methyltransferase RsmH [Vicinamibacterales bacterium]